MKNMPAIVVLAALLQSAAPLARDVRNTIPEQDVRNTIRSSRTHYKMPVFTMREAWLERAAFSAKADPGECGPAADA